jgi:nucleotide-binding universal stress UspA family protein
VVQIVSPTGDDDRAAAERGLQETADAVGQPDVETALLEDEDVTERILAETEHHDVTVVGATRRSRLQQIVFGTVPERIGRRAQNVTIMTKRGAGPTTRLAGRVRRWAGG